jgi:hypothetical protein
LGKRVVCNQCGSRAVRAAIRDANAIAWSEVLVLVAPGPRPPQPTASAPAPSPTEKLRTSRLRLPRRKRPPPPPSGLPSGTHADVGVQWAQLTGASVPGTSPRAPRPAGVSGRRACSKCGKPIPTVTVRLKPWATMCPTCEA